MTDEGAFTCRSCGSRQTELVLDLGLVPASDTFPRASDQHADAAFPLQFYWCRECALFQLGPATVLAPETPTAVDSATAIAHGEESVASILRDEGITRGQSVIELDSGHGNSWLPALRSAGLVERPVDARADLVIDLHHLMHEQSMDAVLAAHKDRLEPGGTLVCEFYYARPLIQKRLVDTIRHGHFLYPSLTSALPALQRHGLTPTRAVEVDVYGGSLRVSAKATEEATHIDRSIEDVLAAERTAGLADPAATAAFAADARKVASEFRRRMEVFATEGQRVAGYGAPSKAAVLLTLAQVDRSLLPFTVDLSPAKAGRRIPGTGVPIRPVEALLEEAPDVVVVLTWDIATEVAAQLTKLAAQTTWEPRLFVPLPEPREVRLG